MHSGAKEGGILSFVFYWQYFSCCLGAFVGWVSVRLAPGFAGARSVSEGLGV